MIQRTARLDPAQGRASDDRVFGFNQPSLIAVALALSPSDIVVFQGGVTVYLTEVLLWAVCGACLSISVLSERRDAITQFVSHMPAAAAYAVWIAIAALLALGLEGAPEQLGKVKNVLPGFLLAAVVIHTVRNREVLRMIFLALMVGAALNGALVLFQVAVGGPYPVEPHENAVWKKGLDGNYVDTFAIGFFGTPNALGNAVMPPVVIGTAILVLGAGFSYWSRLSVLFCLGLSLTGLFFSAHKGAIAWAAIGVAISLWPFRHRGAFALLAVIGGVVAILGLSLSLKGGEMPGGDTVLARLRLMEAFLWQADERPAILLYGNGADGLTAKTGLLASWRFDGTHNTWLDQVMFFGVPGLVLYGLIWLAALGGLAGTERTATRSDASILAMLLGSSAAFAGSIFFEPRADGAFAVAQIMLLLALSVVARRLTCRHPQFEFVSGASVRSRGYS